MPSASPFRSYFPATALILLLGPGWLAARAWGLRRWTAAGAALPLGAAVVGLAEILAAAAGARWLPWGWAVIAALTCASLDRKSVV